MKIHAFGNLRLLSTAALIILCAGAMRGSAFAEPTVPIEETRAAVEQWVETKRLISREKRDLAVAKETLGQRIELVTGEIESLRGQITEAEKGIADIDVKRGELETRNEELKEATSSLEEAAGRLEASLRKLLPQLPEPLQEKIRPLTQRIPEQDAEIKLTLSERFQNAVGILNEIEKFNREITILSEVRTLPDGTVAEVTAMYLGIGHGYYVGRSGNVAGVGWPGPEGWTWNAADKHAPEIAAAIAIFNNEQPAAFVRLPVEIQ